MSCEVCNIHRGDFPTDGKYLEVARKVNSLKDEGAMTELGLAPECPTEFVIRYRCQSCGQVWRLSVPDYAFRGGYEEEVTA
jgi:hypothetical protein